MNAGSPGTGSVQESTSRTETAILSVVQRSGLPLFGYHITKNVRVQSVTPGNAGTSDGLTSSAVLTLSNGRTLNADLYIPATGMKPSMDFLDPSLLSPDGRLKVNSKTLRADDAGERIYGVGDVATYSRPAVHLTLNAIPIVSTNIKRDLFLALTGENVDRADREYHEDTSETQLVPIGRRKGVGAAMRWRLSSFVVWLIKGRDYWLWTTGTLWSGKKWARES